MQQALGAFKRSKDSDEGFTLIELMVVVLIIAILIAIAIPTFLGARTRAQDKSAQSSLRNALTAAKTIYTDHETYADALTAGNLSGVEPSLTYNVDSAASDGPKNVSVAASASGKIIVMAAESSSGSCYFLRDDLTAGSTKPGTYFGKVATGDCTPPDPATLTGLDTQW